jgi:hypothetical protein
MVQALRRLCADSAARRRLSVSRRLGKAVASPARPFLPGLPIPWAGAGEFPAGPVRAWDARPKRAMRVGPAAQSAYPGRFPIPGPCGGQSPGRAGTTIGQPHRGRSVTPAPTTPRYEQPGGRAFCSLLPRALCGQQATHVDASPAKQGRGNLAAAKSRGGQAAEDVWQNLQAVAA